ncbi:MAG: transglutaminase family protein [Bacteroidales bacterium]|nr:transglutaminase family protein [Bacteroidales bacterium]
MSEKSRFVSRFSILIISIFILLPVILITLKYTIWGYSYKKILPKTSYDVSVQMNANSYGEALYIKTFVPMSDSRQSIYNEVLNSPGFTHEVVSNEFGRESKWYIANADGAYHIDYSFSFMGKALQFNIDTMLRPEANIPPGLSTYLESTENIQINHPVIEQIYQEKINPFDKTIDILHAIMDYTYSMKSKPFKGLTDAVTAAKLNEASCNGKSRLFVALARKAGIPARLVGG